MAATDCGIPLSEFERDRADGEGMDGPTNWNLKRGLKVFPHQIISAVVICHRRDSQFEGSGMGFGKTRVGLFVWSINTQLCLSMKGIFASKDQQFKVDTETNTYHGWKPRVGATFATCGTTLALTS
jgi:hypothetical protein